MANLANDKIHSLITDNIDIWTNAIKKRNATGRGSNKKIELTGIKNLRELILELAVRGKLVPQDPNDEAASVLLERISVKKLQLVKEGQLKKQKALPDINDDEKSFDLPKGWEWTRLADLTEIGPRNPQLADDVDVSFVPMPLVSTSYKGAHGSETRKWKEIKKSYTHFADGDIALAKITPCFENSKAAVFSQLVNGIGAGTTELHVARPIPETLDPLFILLYLKAPIFLKVGKTKMTGSAGQKRLPRDFFANNLLPFAPIKEQHRIVAKVDELMALCDQLESQTENSISAHQTLVEVLLSTLTNSADAKEFQSNWARIAEHFDTLFTTEHAIDQLKQTILQLAVMGKLVPQNPNDEPASKLLERIANEKEQLIADNKIKKQKLLPVITDEEKPFKLPLGWEWVTLSHLGVFTGGKTPSKANPAYWGGGIPWVTPKDMKCEMIEGSIDHVTNRAISDGLAEIQEESLLFVARSGILRRKFPVAITKTVCTVNQDLKVLSLFDTSLAPYLLIMMKGFEAYILSKLTKVGTTVESLLFDDFSKHYFMLPSEKEQKQIIYKVEQLMLLCDQLKTSISDSQVTQLQLADTLVRKAI